MRILNGSGKIKSHLKYPVVTFGNYDGVHKGHIKIIKKVVECAKKRSGTSILFTFTPHPVKTLAPGLAPPILQTDGQKMELIDSMGIDIVVFEPFTKKLAELSADDFFHKTIVRNIGAKEIIVGYDFTFGQHRSGTTNELKMMAEKEGIKVSVIDAVFLRDSLISSTHIRHYIERGEMEAAKSMLSRPYAISGRVVKGRGIGSELGFHTANLKTDNELIPPPGVYITATYIRKPKTRYASITNIGFNPTFGTGELSIETHILDFKKNLLGRDIEVEFYKKIRREMTFESIEALRQQIEKDVIRARRYYEKRISVR